MRRVRTANPADFAEGPTAETFYANVTGSPLVFTVGGPQIQPLLAEFRDHRVMAFPSEKVTRLVLRWPGQTLTSPAKPVPSAGPSAWKRLHGSEGSASTCRASMRW